MPSVWGAPCNRGAMNLRPQAFPCLKIDLVSKAKRCILFWSSLGYSEFRYCGVVGVLIIFLQLSCFFCPPNIICNAFTTKRWSYENKRCISGGEGNLFDLRDTNSQLNSMLYLSICLSMYLPIKPSWDGNIQVFERNIL